jgi:hypothetical protein
MKDQLRFSTGHSSGQGIIIKHRFQGSACTTHLSWATCSLSLPIAISVATLPFKNSSGNTPAGLPMSAAAPAAAAAAGVNAAPLSWTRDQNVHTSRLWGSAVVQQ